VSKASELLPEPETPVSTTSFFFGMVDAAEVVLPRAADLDVIELHLGTAR
jgi:hypothetical protein